MSGVGTNEPHVLPPGDTTGIERPGGPWGWG